jgi:Kef-type K+ transport system membrane component KefB
LSAAWLSVGVLDVAVPNFGQFDILLFVTGVSVGIALIVIIERADGSRGTGVLKVLFVFVFVGGLSSCFFSWWEWLVFFCFIARSSLSCCWMVADTSCVSCCCSLAAA